MQEMVEIVFSCGSVFPKKPSDRKNLTLIVT